MARRVFSVSMDEELVKQVDDLAAAQSISRSEYIVRLCREGMAGDEVTVKMMSNPVLVQALMGAFSDPAVVRAMASTMRQQVNDDQLQLFMAAMETTAEKLNAKPKKAPAASLPAPAKKKRKGKK